MVIILGWARRPIGGIMDRCTWRDDCKCDKCIEIKDYEYRKYNPTYGDGEIILRFTGNTREAIKAGKKLAKEKGYSVTMYTKAYGRGGSVLLNPWG